MKQLTYILLFVFFISCQSNTSSKQENSTVSSHDITSIAFGSCNRQDKEQPLWDPILSHNPDVWIWLGDNIYGDTEDMEILKEKYDLQSSNPDYQKLVASASIIGTWDDHDYGQNDAGKEYPKKKESRELMYDFLGVEKESELRKREGGYSAHLFGSGKNMVKVILLDARYFRDALEKDEAKAYIPNETGTILGEAQWEWLEQELSKKDAVITLIGSGIQFIPEEHPYEKWHNFPAERTRFFNILQKTAANGVFLMSGDRHIAEISKIDIEGMEHALFEITSSGLTHTWKEARDEPNKYRIGDLIARLNYGVFNFVWNEEDVEVTVDVRGENSELFLSQKLVVKR